MSEDEYDALPEEGKAEVDRKRLEIKKERLRREMEEKRQERERREREAAEAELRRLEEEKYVLHMICKLLVILVLHCTYSNQ